MTNPSMQPRGCHQHWLSALTNIFPQNLIDMQFCMWPVEGGTNTCTVDGAIGL